MFKCERCMHMSDDDVFIDSLVNIEVNFNKV